MSDAPVHSKPPAARVWAAAFSTPQREASSARACRSHASTVARVSCALYALVLAPLALSVVLPPGWATAAKAFAKYSAAPSQQVYTLLPAETHVTTAGGHRLYLRLYKDVVV